MCGSGPRIRTRRSWVLLFLASADLGGFIVLYIIAGSGDDSAAQFLHHEIIQFTFQNSMFDLFVCLLIWLFMFPPDL